MLVEAAARIFHDWAYAEGLMVELAVRPSTNLTQMGVITPITESGKQILRAKQVQAIGLDEVAHEITVFTKRAAPKSKKQLNDLPQSIGNVAIKYRQAMRNAIGDQPATPFGTPPFTIRIINGSKYYACGSSISVGNVPDAGTMGCLVRDTTGTVYGLSNNHISGSCSFASVGMPILAPGVFDVAANSLNPFTLGLHHRALPFLPGSPDNINHRDNLDAAIFKIHEPNMVSSYQGNFYDTPLLCGPMKAQMKVEKVGRTTGHTIGTVHSQIFGASNIAYNVTRYSFSGVIYFEPLFLILGENGTAFSDNGDSGSLVTSVDTSGNRLAVGLVVGGGQDSSAPGGKTSLVFPIESILQKLGVTLVSGHNV